MAILLKAGNRAQNNGDFRLMTKEEILESVSMRDVVERYGIRINHNGMCCCPIHSERHPSMKIYKDGYKCFACNSSGDIFSFVQAMEGCDFKTAFKILGGSYKKESSNARKCSKARIERQKEKKKLAEKNEKDFRKLLMNHIDLCNWWLSNREPYSDDWCFAQNTLQWLWHVYDTKYLEEGEINEIDVLGKCKQIKQRFLAV